MHERLELAISAAPSLRPYASGLRKAFEALGTEAMAVQRVHGDFHLGQTLHTPTGWKIIDFEGEPAKSLAERQAPDSVWRDIAGMLRSFDYAAASVPGPDSATWAAACRQAFLEGYARGPLESADVTTLRAYEADKAIYEVIYEVRNRPDWVEIPLAAVAALAASSPMNGRQADRQQNALADPAQSGAASTKKEH
jgi:maltokinase